MGELRVRNVPDWLVDWYKASAKQQGQTFENHMRQMLEDFALSHQAAFAAHLQERLDFLARKYNAMPDSAPLIRETREELG